VAGLGTRFLPATKAIPKEMLPVVDRPLIQHAVDEAVQAGVEHIILVNRGDKAVILDHFAPVPELEQRLLSKDQTALLDLVRSILPKQVTLEVAIQEEALGLGHAVLCARELVGPEEAFAVILPDDMVRTRGPGALAQLVDLHQRTGASVIGVEAIDPDQTGSYGIAAVEMDADGRQRIVELVEKPDPREAPSNLGVVGRYVLEAKIFSYLEDQNSGAGGEIQLTDAIARMMAVRPVMAQTLVGVRYDCGSRLGMLKANLDYALDDESLRDSLVEHLQTRLANLET
jgi:UTP--glucose-1-phosphate uridylyltransferase